MEICPISFAAISVTTLQGALKFLLHNTAKFGCSSDIVILLQILGEIQL